MSQLGRDPDEYPMPLFTPEDQESLAAHIEEAREEFAEKNECWDEAEHIEVEERWLHRWKDPAGHARVIAEMDVRGDRPPVEWRRPHGRVRRNETHVDDGEAEGSHARFKRRSGEINNYRSVGGLIIRLRLPY